MKSKNIDNVSEKSPKKVQDVQVAHNIAISPEMGERVAVVNEQDSAIGGLTLMLERTIAYFQQIAPIDDRETLVFCLHHLFRHVDMLYCETLPMLTTIIHTRTAPSVSSSHTSHIAFRYTLWTHLQQMQQHIERIESLCHLLNRTVPRLLSVLDTPTLHRDDATTSITQNSTQHDIEQWQRAYEQLTKRLNTWQERNGERFTFASDNESVHLLTRIDASLMLVLDSVGAIFGDIVPDFQVVAHGDDEVVATLLFDLMQQGDLLLIQCDALFGPLQDLIRHYMLSE